jgi:uncharacterized membrane protein YfhO
LAFINLAHYQPNNLRYSTNNTTDQLAVFSEIYYPDGWKVFVDGQKTDHFRVNYVLRGMIVPAGAKEIEFRFEPRSYYVGERIALAFSILMALMMLHMLGKRDTPIGKAVGKGMPEVDLQFFFEIFR